MTTNIIGKFIFKGYIIGSIRQIKTSNLKKNVIYGLSRV